MILNVVTVAASIYRYIGMQFLKNQVPVSGLIIKELVHSKHMIPLLRCFHISYYMLENYLHKSASRFLTILNTLFGGN